MTAILTSKMNSTPLLLHSTESPASLSGTLCEDGGPSPLVGLAHLNKVDDDDDLMAPTAKKPRPNVLPSKKQRNSKKPPIVKLPVTTEPMPGVPASGFTFQPPAPSVTSPPSFPAPPQVPFKFTPIPAHCTSELAAAKAQIDNLIFERDRAQRSLDDMTDRVNLLLQEKKQSDLLLRQGVRVAEALECRVQKLKKRIETKTLHILWWRDHHREKARRLYVSEEHMKDLRSEVGALREELFALKMQPVVESARFAVEMIQTHEGKWKKRMATAQKVWRERLAESQAETQEVSAKVAKMKKDTTEVHTMAHKQAIESRAQTEGLRVRVAGLESEVEMLRKKVALYEMKI